MGNRRNDSGTRVAHSPLMAKARRTSLPGVALKPSVRLFALAPMLIAIGSVVLDFLLLEFFGAFFLAVVSLLVYAGVGFVLALRLPRHPVGWLLLWAGALFELSFAAAAYAWAAFIRMPGTLPLGAVALPVGHAWMPALGCLFLAIMLFPTGGLPSPRWRVPLAFVVSSTALVLAANLLGPRAFPVPTQLFAQGAPTVTVANPLAIDGPLATLLGYVSSSPLAFFVYLIPVAAIVVRFRTATGNEQEQLKWFAYTSSIVTVFFVAAGVVPVFSYLAGLGPLVAVVLMDLIPISVAIAILRYRLYDIDVLIRRTLTYAVLSAVLFVAYVAGVAITQFVFSPVTSGNGLAVAVSTLAVVALFQPLRGRIRSSVDRRFYRRRYDAVRTLDSFAVRLRDEIDLDALQAELITAVGATVQPVHASLWLRGAR
jgi:hypothetical protein